MGPDEFYNPVLQGCYPDPAITRKGDDYYLVCSSFAMFPGVPVFHSNDLANWTQIGHVPDRTSQLDVHNTGISAGVYAPGITCNPYNDTFYMITTAFAGGLRNIIVKTKDPREGWSEPIKLNFGGIDPSILFDEDGKAKLPAGVTNKTTQEGFFPNGNFTCTGDFSSNQLNYRWIGLRGPREEFIEITKQGLLIKPFEANIKELKSTSTLFYRQQHNNFSFETSIDYKPGSEKDLVGIVCLQHEGSNYIFGITGTGDDYILLFCTIPLKRTFFPSCYALPV